MASFRTHRKVREKRESAKQTQLRTPRNRREMETMTISPTWVGQTEIRVGRARWTIGPGDRIAQIREDARHGVVYVLRATGHLHLLIDVAGQARELILPKELAAQAARKYFPQGGTA